MELQWKYNMNFIYISQINGITVVNNNLFPSRLQKKFANSKFCSIRALFHLSQMSAQTPRSSGLDTRKEHYASILLYSGQKKKKNTEQTQQTLSSVERVINNALLPFLYERQPITAPVPTFWLLFARNFMKTDAISLTWKCGTSGISHTLSLIKTSWPAVVFP